jgi:transcriptional regulator with XRE-family HTH domain
MLSDCLNRFPAKGDVPNKLIVGMGELIRQARVEQGLTQQDIANHLGRTAASISEMERGKVQVSASDLFKIAQLLNKPIEYFYGEEYGEKEIQDFIALIRKQNPEARASSVSTTSMLLRLFSLGEELKSIPEDQPIPVEKTKEFFAIFIPFSDLINKMTSQLNDIRDKLIEEMKIQGIDI